MRVFCCVISLLVYWFDSVRFGGLDITQVKREWKYERERQAFPDDLNESVAAMLRSHRLVGG